MSNKSSYDLELRHPFTYHNKGEEATAGFIRLDAPTSRHAGQIADLKQYLFRSFPEVEDDGTEKDTDTDQDPELTGPQVLTLFYKAENVSFKQVLLTAKELFTTKPSIALVDGEQAVTNPILYNINPDDFERMTGEYIARFIAASAWSILKSD